MTGSHVRGRRGGTDETKNTKIHKKKTTTGPRWRGSVVVRSHRTLSCGGVEGNRCGV